VASTQPLVPQLRVQGAAVPALPATDAESWRNPDGSLTLYAQRTGSTHRVTLPGIAVFAFGPDGDTVSATPDPQATPALLEDSYYRIILPLVLQTRGIEMLHASAVRLPAGVLAFCALAETGKSTLAYALARRGYPQWSDDAVAWRLRDPEKRVEAVPLLFRSSLRPASAAYFGDLPATVPRLPAPDSVPLAAVCVLDRQPDGHDPPFLIERLPPPLAFRAVMSHGQVFDWGEAAHQRATFEHYLALGATVPVWSVRFCAGLDHLPALLDAILAVCA
jgi:hypothetical protein